MRVIAGQAKGRKLVTLEGDATRPTTGKVRAALFNILAAWVPDGAWLDLYAGSGAVGLEAASRGARRVVLVESGRAAQAVIRENLATLKLPGVELLAATVEAALTRVAGPFDVIFLDPPYSLDAGPVLAAIAQTPLLAPEGRVVLEHHADRPPAPGGLTLLRTARYAETALSFYAVSEAP